MLTFFANCLQYNFKLVFELRVEKLKEFRLQSRAKAAEAEMV